MTKIFHLKTEASIIDKLKRFVLLFVETFGLVGLEPLAPFIVYGAKRQSEQDKMNTLADYKKRLAEITN
ncbi:MAG: hypothetical protein CFE24_00630 [Flavobacterium sp. BFFFF2]|nr:MAG: hypothetical protein CFE24_00630 [Flavobacterium sp. BFFFF2]